MGWSPWLPSPPTLSPSPSGACGSRTLADGPEGDGEREPPPVVGQALAPCLPAPRAGVACGVERPAGAGLEVEAVGEAARQALGAGPGHHGGIVACTAPAAARAGYSPARGRPRPGRRAICRLAATPPATTRWRGSDPSRPTLRSSMSGGGEGSDPQSPWHGAPGRRGCRTQRPGSRRTDRRCRPRCSGASACAWRRTAVFSPAKEKCGSAPPEHRARQREPPRPAAGGGLLHGRPAGKAQPQELRGLVEGLAQGVVDGGAETLVAADAVHDQELGVPARDQQQKIGRAQALGEADGERVRLQVVDRHQRQARAPGRSPWRSSRRPAGRRSARAPP